MLGTAQLPPVPLLGEPPPPDVIANRDPFPREDERRAGAAPAAAIARGEVARTRGQLPPRHRPEEPGGRIRTPVDLHDLVGRRESGLPIAVTLGWARELGPLPADIASATELIAWAERTHRLHAATEQPGPGDLLVFDHATGDEPADLIAIVIGRDARGVLEMIYVAGGVVRRGFVDATRPRQRRDAEGAVVNTYLRHSKRQPPKGTRFLAGELLASVVRVRQ